MIHFLLVAPSHRPAAFVSRIALLLSTVLVLGGCAGGYGRRMSYHPNHGDLVFQSLPRNDLVDAIEGASGSPFSHCGLVRSTATGWAVVEALGVVKETSLEQWIDQGRDRAVFVFRFKSSTPELLQSVVAEARKFQGRPYDSRYRMDDESIYCSELLYKAHLNATGKPLGQTCRLGELSWKPFEDLITRIEQGPVPLDREMITPKAVAEAPELIFVGEF